MNTGIYADLSNDDYHNGEGVSRSTLWTIWNKSPAHAHDGEKPESKALDFGKALHMGVLEPMKFGHFYGRLPDGHNSTTKEGKAAKAALEAQGLEPIKADKYDGIIAIRNKLLREPLIAKALNGAQFEHSAYSMDDTTGVLVKCRPDAYNPALKIMLDLKTTEDASAEGFAKSMATYGYDFQEAFYRDAWERAGGGDVDAFVFIAVEKELPFAYSIFELGAEDVEIGRAMYRNTLVRYAQCQKENAWPAYPAGVQNIAIPQWARVRRLEALGLSKHDGLGGAA